MIRISQFEGPSGVRDSGIRSESFMGTITLDAERELSNPLDAVEQVFSHNNWPFERRSDEDITVEIAGRWCAYQLWFSWRVEISALQFSCAFDMKVPEAKHDSIYRLLGLANERLWFGHFVLWSDEGLPVFRHAMLLRECPGLSSAQMQDTIDIALTESERFYPAFQHVIWGGKSPDEALALALVDTLGEA
jgi:hypothetical protein